jgi:hypothetical protein
MKLFTHILIFTISIGSLVVAYYTGPIANIGALVSVNESYIQILQKQYIYSGLVTAVACCVSAYLFKANLKVVAIILLASGSIWVTFSQLSEPDFLTYFLESVTEFMVPYVLVCLVALTVLFCVNKKWPRLT